MKVSLNSPVPGFQKELLDVAGIFLGAISLVGIEDAQVLMQISENVQGNTRNCTADLSGELSGNYQLTEQVQADALVEKRLHKRQQKLALYHAFVQAAGYQPPWGSLTGVRPTRLVLEQMKTGQSLEEAVQTVQHDFDLQDETTQLLEDTLKVQLALPPAKDNEVACYIGIPFCVSRCRYCSFVSQEVGDGALLPVYTDALMEEIKGTIALMNRLGLVCRSFYVGGGTPTSLADVQLQQVLKAAGPLILQAREVTVEAGRPDTITSSNLRIMTDAGVGRISVNPQTMHDSTLQFIGRRHSKVQAEEAFVLARQAGFRHINMDLIAGLQGEDEAMFAQSLQWVLSLDPEAITVHALSIKRSSDMHRYMDQLTSSAPVLSMVQTARQQVTQKGFEPYYLYRQKHMAGNVENVGYAKPGHACLYNIDMMEDQTTVLAMGAGAITKRVWPDRVRIERAPNVKNPKHYIARTQEMLERKIALFEGDKA